MWSDIFYPDNPKRREELIRKSQELQILMENNFRATNRLIDVMNEHLGCSFEHIALNQSATLKENCDVIIECIHKIQAEVESIDIRLKEKLEPTLYEKLQNLPSLSAVDFQTISNVFTGICGVGGMATFATFMYAINNGIILANVSSACLKVAAGAFGAIGLAVVFMGIDMIVGAIIGKIERDRLEKELKQYDMALEEFKPASIEYQDSISEVQAAIKIYAILSSNYK